jgi:hypothetical protein
MLSEKGIPDGKEATYSAAQWKLDRIAYARSVVPAEQLTDQ